MCASSRNILSNRVELVAETMTRRARILRKWDGWVSCSKSYFKLASRLIDIAVKASLTPTDLLRDTHIGESICQKSKALEEDQGDGGLAEHLQSVEWRILSVCQR